MDDYQNVLTSNIATTEADIVKLSAVKKNNYTAMQLHQKRNAMLNRAQRIENRRYWRWVQKQKVLSANKLTSYKDKLTSYNTLLAEQAALPVSKDLKVLQPMFPALSEPMTTPLLLPKKIQTRASKRRLKQSRYGY